MSTLPIVHQPKTRTYSRDWRRRLDGHNAIVASHGVELPRPTDALITQAITYANDVTDAREQRDGRKRSKAERWAWERRFVKGMVGAELLANRWGLHCIWSYIGDSDEHFDIVVPTTGLLIDAKTKKGFLCVEPKDLPLQPPPHYFALVQRRRDDDHGPYVYCGVITPEVFRYAGFPYYEGTQLWAVSARDLILPCDFDPWAKR